MIEYSDDSDWNQRREVFELLLYPLISGEEKVKNSSSVARTSDLN